MTPKDPFLRGLSGTNSGGRFAPGRFCSLPKNEVGTKEIFLEQRRMTLRKTLRNFSLNV